MDEAALCDRIALIQKGEILKIDSPENIIKNYDKTIYEIRSHNMHLLILDLKNYPSQYSVYAFGEYIHFIDKNANFNSTNLQFYLQEKKHSEIEINVSRPTIEDVFMDL
jgi:ABC-type multidrug transport system ATPase subunit